MAAAPRRAARNRRDFRTKISTGEVVVVLTPFYGLATSGEVVVIPPGADTAEFLDTHVHEFLHKSCPNMAEKEVARIADDLSTLIWKSGYRLGR